MTAIAPDVSLAPAAVPLGRTIPRIAGFAGLAFVAIVASRNVIFGAASPPANDASATGIADFIAANKTSLMVQVGVVPLAVVALYAFIACATERFRRGSADAAAWTRLGMCGLIIVEPLFMIGMLFEYVLVARSTDLAARGAVTETLWQLRSGTLILVGVALAVGLIGLSRAGRISGLIPAWQERLGYVAAGTFLVSAGFAVATIEGSPVGLIGLVAFVGWLVWLTLTSIRLLRTADTSA